MMIRPRLFFVKMDIKAAFDTIKQDRIMDIITSFLDKVCPNCFRCFRSLRLTRRTTITT